MLLVKVKSTIFVNENFHKIHSNISDAKALIDILYTSNSYLVYLKITCEYRFERFRYLCTLSNVSVFARGAAMHSCGCRWWRRWREAIGPSLNQRDAVRLLRPLEPPYVISSRRSHVAKCNFFFSEANFLQKVERFRYFCA